MCANLCASHDACAADIRSSVFAFESNVGALESICAVRSGKKAHVLGVGALKCCHRGALLIYYKENDAKFCREVTVQTML